MPPAGSFPVLLEPRRKGVKVNPDAAPDTDNTMAEIIPGPALDPVANGVRGVARPFRGLSNRPETGRINQS